MLVNAINLKGFRSLVCTSSAALRTGGRKPGIGPHEYANGKSEIAKAAVRAWHTSSDLTGSDFSIELFGLLSIDRVHVIHDAIDKLDGGF